MEFQVPLDEESKRFVSLVNKVGPLDTSLPLDIIRQYAELSSAKFRGDFEFSGSKENMLLPTVSSSNQHYKLPVTVLKPTLNDKYNNIMVFFHGGGWVFGSRETHMAICEIFAIACNCVVVNVEYRLAPEHKFPACYEDAKNVVLWCLQNKSKLANNPESILGVVGDSAGGNISASVCQLVKGIDYQILIYACLTLVPDLLLHPSTIKYHDGYNLTSTIMKWFKDQFLISEDDAATPLASPSKSSSFAGLPPALFIVAECDPLADQSIEYQRLLENAGVMTRLVLLKGVVHGFCGQPGLFKKTNKRMVEDVKKFLSKL